MLISLTCPKCKKEVTVEVAETEKPLERIAISHGDHVIFVEYDNHGDIRTTEVFDIGKPGNFYITCPRCGTTERFAKPEKSAARIAFPHDDHVLLVYIIGSRIIAESVPLTVPKVAKVERNVIAEVAGVIGYKLLASIILEPIVEGSRIVYAPGTVAKDVEEIFSAVKYLRTVEVLAGTPSKLDVDLSYVTRFLEGISKLPEAEALGRLDRFISVLEGLIESSRNKFRENPFQLIKALREIGNKEIAAIIVAALERRYGIHPPSGLM